MKQTLGLDFTGVGILDLAVVERIGIGKMDLHIWVALIIHPLITQTLIAQEDMLSSTGKIKIFS